MSFICPSPSKPSAGFSISQDTLLPKFLQHICRGHPARLTALSALLSTLGLDVEDNVQTFLSLGAEATRQYKEELQKASAAVVARSKRLLIPVNVSGASHQETVNLRKQVANLSSKLLQSSESMQGSGRIIADLRKDLATAIFYQRAEKEDSCTFKQAREDWFILYK